MLHIMAGDNYGESPIEFGREEKTLTNVHIVHCETRQRYCGRSEKKDKMAKRGRDILTNVK